MIRLPAEWEPQAGIILTWPHAGTDWQSIMQEVETVYIEITEQISQFERVIIISNDEDHKHHIQSVLSRHDICMDNITIPIAPSNDTWARDHGPITVYTDEKPVLLDFKFNGWGEKFPAELDNTITRNVHKTGIFGSTVCKTIDFVLEGGSIESDGKGTLLTTTSCLLSRKRNPDLDQQEITNTLSKYLGADRVIWFQNGHIQGDDTDGHIDTLIRFVDSNTIMYVTTDDTDNPNYTSLQKMKDELQQLKDTQGNAYKLVPLPSPVISNETGDYLPASYANFLIINDAVLIPVYGVNSDNFVINLFKEFFVDRKIIPINCLPLIQQSGSLHCITMQLPAGVI